MFLASDEAQSVGNGIWHKALMETPDRDANGETDGVEKPGRTLAVGTVL